MLMVFFTEIFILLVKCSYVFMSEKKSEFDTTLTENCLVKNGDIISIKDDFLKFAASNEKFGLFLFDKATAEYKIFTGLS